MKIAAFSFTSVLVMFSICYFYFLALRLNGLGEVSANFYIQSAVVFPSVFHITIKNKRPEDSGLFYTQNMF